MTWAQLEIFIHAQVEELDRMLQDPYYVSRHARIQEMLAVMIIRAQEVHVLAMGEQNLIDPQVKVYAEAQARARLRALRNEA